jgi:hypothetical protein
MLQRAHAVVDDMVFREAKADAQMKPAYVQLTALHSNFAALVNKCAPIPSQGSGLRNDPPRFVVLLSCTHLL